MISFRETYVVSGILNRIFRQKQRQSEAPIALSRIATYHEYIAHLDRMTSEYNMRRQVERSLILNQNSFTVPGWCFVCRTQVSLSSRHRNVSVRHALYSLLPPSFDTGGATLFCRRGYFVAPHRTGLADFPHPALQLPSLHR
jgi:hypothetical protein